MPVVKPILPALLLLGCCSFSAHAQQPAPAPSTPGTATPGAPAQTSASPATTTPPPDPCEANATTVDFDTCYADQFKLADQDLNHIYRATIVALEHDLAEARKRPDDSELTYDSTAILDLKSAQTAWVKYRDLHCKAAGQQVQGGSIQPIVINKCMILVTRHRIDEIRAAYEIGGRSLE